LIQRQTSLLNPRDLLKTRGLLKPVDLLKPRGLLKTKDLLKPRGLLKTKKMHYQKCFEHLSGKPVVFERMFQMKRLN